MVNMQTRNPNVFSPLDHYILLLCIQCTSCWCVYWDITVYICTLHILTARKCHNFKGVSPCTSKRHCGIHFLGKFSCRQWSLCAHCWTKPTAWISSSFHNHDIPQLVSLHPNCHASLIARLHCTSAREHVHAQLCAQGIKTTNEYNSWAWKLLHTGTLILVSWLELWSSQLAKMASADLRKSGVLLGEHSLDVSCRHHILANFYSYLRYSFGTLATHYIINHPCGHKGEENLGKFPRSQPDHYWLTRLN